MNAETPASEQITAWLTDWRAGDADASERLFAAVYPQLRRIAARFLHNERDGHTLEPNALVNELCLRFLGSKPIDFKDRAHFFAIAAQMMRRILVDYARARRAAKREGGLERVTLQFFGESGILTARMTEQPEAPAGAKQYVSWVSLIWIKESTQWRLSDVRILGDNNAR